MNFNQVIQGYIQEEGVTESTMMGTLCLRYKGDFVSMFFAKEDSLIIKVSAQRVNQLIEEGLANEFNFTKKRFKEWALIPIEFEDMYPAYIEEALEYARLNNPNTG